MQVALTDATFKTASWDWVQDATTATTKWGAIGDWDVSGVADFTRALSTVRNEAGEGATNGNLKAAFFVGTSLSKWITISATSMQNTFYGASEMNIDVSGWDVAKVTNLQATFRKASKFQGTGIDQWITSSLVTMQGTFMQAVTMDADLSKWNVATVTTLSSTFYNAVKFTASGLDSWDTASVANLDSTFYLAGEVNIDLGAWDVAKVTTLENTFQRAYKCAGTGLGSWDTTSVTTLRGTFDRAGEMNSNLGGWNVAKVTTLYNTFIGASKFAGTGLPTWDIAKVTTMSDTFTSPTSLTSCNKRKIVDAWTPISAVFVATTYDTDWAGEPWCVGAALSDAQFKQASWDWVQDTATATSKWGAIGGWDVSGVADMSWAFSKNRDELNNGLHGSSVTNGNPNAVSFTGAGLDSWITGSVTTLRGTFKEADSMNVNLGSWDVTKVTTMYHTFFYAVKFVGEGLESWNVAAVTDMGSTFRDARLFIGTGLGKWTTGPLTSV